MPSALAQGNSAETAASTPHARANGWSVEESVIVEIGADSEPWQTIGNSQGNGTIVKSDASATCGRLFDEAKGAKIGFEEGERLVRKLFNLSVQRALSLDQKSCEAS